MSTAAVDASAVLDFLRRNSLLDAESALRAELAAAEGRVSLGSDYADELPAPPPPVRVAVGARGDGSGSVSLSDDDDEEFVSMGSVANSDLVNPYGVWSSSRAESSDSSSDRVSEFGTAREYSDSYWYNEKGGFPSSPWSVDKFVTNIEMEDENEKPIEALSTRGSGTSAKDISFLGSTDPFFQSSKVSQGDLKHVYVSARLDFRESPLCDCCNKVKGSYEDESTSTGIIVGVEDSKLSNMSPYDFSEMMCAEPKSLDYPELTKFQLEFVDNVTEIVSWKQSTMHYSHRGTNSSAKEQVMFPPFPDQELQILDSFADDRISFPAGELSNSTIHMEHASGEDFQENFRIHSEDFEQALPGATGSLENHGEAVEESHNSGNIRDGDEEQGTPTELKVFENIDDEFEIFDLRIIHRKNRTGFEEKKDFPIVLNTIIAGRYYVTEYLGSAAFSKVVQAHDLQTGMDVCLKIIKNDKDFFDQSLDEIKLLKFVNKNDPADEHHILRLYDYFYHQEHLFIVSELLRANLYEFQKFNYESGGELYFTLPRLQRIVRQCLEALEYLHRLGVIHCDLKPENILVKSYSRCEIKVIDLGSSCFQSDNLCLYVQSRSYRAPEVILGVPYDQKIDVWSLGCILAELWSGDVLFPNESMVMMLSRMIGILGPIDLEMLIRGQDTHKYFTCNYDLYHRNEEACELEYIIPEKSSLARHLGVSDAKFLEFLSKLLQTNPLRRPTASEALRHSWFSHQYENIPCSSK